MVNLNKIYKALKVTSKFYFVNGDIRDELKLERVFKTYEISKVIHLAGLKSVSESFTNEMEYKSVNVQGSDVVLNLAIKYSVQSIVFSSTAAVYHPLSVGRYSEKNSVSGTSSPYSGTKLETENLLIKLKDKDVTIDIVILRYFNPVGVDMSGLLIEENISSTNLFPNIIKNIKNDTYLDVYGSDYVTIDGTAIRDFIHINDLIDAHMLMINDTVLSFNVRVFNIGSDTGYSIREVIDEFNKQIDQPVKYIYKPRREGDVQMCIADITKIKKELNWQPKYTLEDMVKSVLIVNNR